MFYELGSQRWMLRGACRQEDPELFFPVAATGAAERQVEAAKAVCAACAVRANCLSYALEARPEGIWGGTTREERRGTRISRDTGTGVDGMVKPRPVPDKVL